MPLTIILPTVNGNDGEWGGMLNTALTSIVDALNANTDADATKLPLSGGALSGRVDMKTATQALVAKGNVSGATPLDLSAAMYFTATIAADTQFTFANVPAGVVGVVLRLTGTSMYAVTWPTGTKWPGGSAPAFSSGVDVVVFLTDDGGTTWRATLAMKDVH